MYAVGDKVKYASGYGIFEGEVIEIKEDGLLVVENEGEVFGLAPSEVITD